MAQGMQYESAQVIGGQVHLTWTDASATETAFRIERATGAGAFAEVGTVGANVTSYDDTTGAPETAYSYRVRATNLGGDSAYSNTATAVTQAAQTVPAAPSNLTATAVSSTQINLAWQDNSNNEDGFKIERCQGNS